MEDNDFLSNFFSGLSGGDGQKEESEPEAEKREQSGSSQATASTRTAAEFSAGGSASSGVPAVSKHRIAGVGKYPIWYRVLHFVLIVGLACLLGGVQYLVFRSLGFAYVGTYIAYCLIAGASLCAAVYIALSLAFMRRKGDWLEQEDYLNMFARGLREADKKKAAIYIRLNGCYYAAVYSYLTVVIVAAAEALFAVALNLGGLL